ncbi:PBP1A family penicillin-binding protein [Hyphomonas sp. WL0036]|uniref:transglycosylase domain-containing protein n=1 Tax=Hyphomonas sediminis TaxID=2866160 RepID=UPI001C815D81|nr:PBP1A family penicillin-binding protein [Hyphomonas sediminis]MBY9065269.1 PBP1A family penicillin-binding protein [Hyphomonas sediminis]
MPRVIRVPAQALEVRQLSPVRILLLAVGFILLCGAGWAFWKWQSLHTGMPKLPEPAALWQAQREPAIEFVDIEGNTLAVRGPRYGRAVSVAELPKHVPQAFIAAEDKRFYEHDGADEAAIARAAISNAAAGETVSGASTITQQVIKNLVLDARQTMQRKAQEITLARQLEKKMSKDEILSLYLNRIYFGAGLYGIDAASRFYFGKPPAELEIHEAALLAALPKAPSKLNLRDNLEGAKSRQLYVLKEMEGEKFISKEQAAAARDAKITIIDAPKYDVELGYALDIAAERLKAMLPQVPGDAVVTLTIDPKIQKRVEAKISARMAKDGKSVSAGQASSLILDRNGAVVSLTGGVDYAASPFNRVTQAKRQPGSSFKPFVYALALEDGYSPYDVFNDRPITIGKWQPTNYSSEYHGPMTLVEAFARSTNTIAAELGVEVNPERIVSLANKFGITSEMEPYPSIALGSQVVSLWELVRAYGVFQTGGYRLDPYIIQKVTDSRGAMYYEHPASERDRVYAEDLAAEMNAMLMRAVNSAHGTGARARIPGWSVAGKTGTSQESRDAWFVGFTAAYVGGVWVGNDDDSPMKRVTGGGLPADIWSDIMKIAHEGKKSEQLFGADRMVLLDPAAEERITFYRGMAQAFAAASGSSRTASRGGSTQQVE